MCGYESCISAKYMHSSLLTDRHIKHFKYIIHNSQNKTSGELSGNLFETYKNNIRPHGCHIYNYAAEWLWKQCVTVPHNITICHTGNVYYAQCFH